MNPEIPDSMRGDEEYLERAMLRRGIIERPVPGSLLERFYVADERMWERLNLEPWQGTNDYTDPKQGSEFNN